MRIYIGFDDTDNITADRGTGKLARWFENELPEGCRVEGVVRQQLLVDDRIPYTSHNSSACVMVDAPDPSLVTALAARAIEHLKRHSLEGSDPGLCVASEGDAALPRLIAFGRACTARIVTQKEALDASSSSHLSGHGGTNDGIIGAAAAVGLTAYGWGGRFIEFGKLREFSEKVPVSDLERSGIAVVSIDRDARILNLEEMVDTKGWLRPRLWGGRVVLPVAPGRDHCWEVIGEKRRKN